MGKYNIQTFLLDVTDSAAERILYQCQETRRNYWHKLLKMRIKFKL